MYHRKYLGRLADVYLEKYNRDGFATAKAWYDEFLSDELREQVRPHIKRKVAESAKKEKL